MKIAHICLSCFYIDGASYQENELVRQHVDDGHNVLVIASTENYNRDGNLTYGDPGSYLGTDGAPVIRLPYSRFLPHKIMRKLRVHPGVYAQLEMFAPDAILFHGACGYEIITVAKYASDHPEIVFHIDSHEDSNNSARGFVSRELLHKLFYRYCLHKALPAAQKLLCVSTETMDFVESTYGISRDRLEFFPLGGKPVPTDKYLLKRNQTRQRLGISSTDIVFLQSGKMSRRKKLLEALRAYSAAAPRNSRFLITGVLQDDIREEAERLIDQDARIDFLGWKSSEELTDILCAADVYLQPGTQSATMQHSLCCHCAVILDDVPSHKIYVDKNGWLINDKMPLMAAISQISEINLAAMRERSFEIAQNLLDYSKLSTRVLRKNS